MDENLCLIPETEPPTCGGRDHSRIRGTYHCFPKSVACLNTYATGKGPLALHQRGYGGYYTDLKLVRMQRLGERGEPSPSWCIYSTQGSGSIVEEE